VAYKKGENYLQITKLLIIKLAPFFGDVRGHPIVLINLTFSDKVGQNTTLLKDDNKVICFSQIHYFIIFNLLTTSFGHYNTFVVSKMLRIKITHYLSRPTEGLIQVIIYTYLYKGRHY